MTTIKILLFRGNISPTTAKVHWHSNINDCYKTGNHTIMSWYWYKDTTRGPVLNQES